jgi:hypothetical protein
MAGTPMKTPPIYLLATTTGALISCTVPGDPGLLELPADVAANASSPESSGLVVPVGP